MDAALYCECTWDKIKEKEISLDKLGKVSDSSSPLFNEIILPCITKAISASGETDEESVTKNPNDIVGGAAVVMLP